MVRKHYHDYFHDDHTAYDRVAAKTFELTEYLVEVAKVTDLGLTFPHKVGLHQSCHGCGNCGWDVPARRSERHSDPPEKLLEAVKGLEIVDLKRTDECCGFGGTFAVSEEAISCLMGRDRIADHIQAGPRS